MQGNDIIGEWLDRWVTFPGEYERQMAVSFVREAHQLQSPQRLAITGLAGSGKTRLLRAMAAICPLSHTMGSWPASTPMDALPPSLGVVFVDAAHIPVNLPKVAMVYYGDTAALVGWDVIHMAARNLRAPIRNQRLFEYEASRVRWMLQSHIAFRSNGK